jgi:cytidylate kinase
MVLSREEKEKMVLDLYYNKGYTYREIARELRMSPNQISEIIKRHEEKNDAIVNKKKMLSLSSQAYKLFSEGKTNVQVAIKLDLPQEQITQFRLEYCRLQNQDRLEQLYMLAKGKVSVLWKIYKELMIIRGLSIEEVASVMNTDHIYHLARLFKELVRKRGMSIEEVAAAVDINLNVLPEMKEELDQTCKAIAKKQLDLDMIKVRISSLEEEENRRRNRIVTLPPSSYRYAENRDNSAMNPFPYHSNSAATPSSLPYWSSGNHDSWSEYRNEEKIKTRPL